MPPAVMAGATRLGNLATQGIAYILGLIFASFFGIKYAWSVLRAPFQTCRTRKQRPYPAVLHDPNLGTHGFVVSNGIKFHFVANGPEEGPLMLCLHGFPECWYSWRYILQAFAGTHRVVAVDLRGYGETTHVEPSYLNASDYALETLVEDVRALIGALGYRQCTLVAHDWGGIIAWAFAYAHPELLNQLIVMNSPHPIAIADTAGLMQLFRSYYVFVFQLPVIPELWLAATDYKFISDAFMGPGMGVRRRGPLALSEADVEVYKWAFTTAGTTTAAVNFYRNIFVANAEYMHRIGVKRSAKLTPPTLCIWGTEDGALGPAIPAATAKYCTDFELAMIPGASHWVQQDAVEETIAAMASFLKVKTRPVFAASWQHSGSGLDGGVSREVDGTPGQSQASGGDRKGAAKRRH